MIARVSDEELQQLKRQWAQSGAREHAVAYLRAAVAAGVLSTQQLELAAYLGYRPALDLLERTDPSGPPRSDSISYGSRLRVWLESLEQFGKGTCVRACLALAKGCKLPNDNPKPPFPNVVDAFAGWVESPSNATVQACKTAVAKLKPARSAPSMGLFNPTGTSDDDDVHYAMEQFERRHGINIDDLNLQEAVFKTAEALVKVTAAEGKPSAVSWFYNILSCQSPRLGCSLEAVVPRALLAEMGLGEQISEEDLVHPCPYHDPDRPVQERYVDTGRPPVAEPYKTLPKDKPKLDLGDKPILRSRREGGLWGILKGLFGSE